MRILVTGATGSFGRHFLRRMRNGNGNKFFALSRDEFKQATARIEEPDVEWILGDLRTLTRIPEVDLIIHAAALKHVGRGEAQPDEFLETNVLGTRNLLRLARQMKAHVIALSTDKACEPVNAYGATKLLLEKLCLAEGHTVVRYGNVLGSRGSLVPMLLRAAENNDTVVMTDPEATRFWITLDDAVDLVETAMQSKPNGIIVPKASSMSVGTMVGALCKTNETVVIGLQPGEKKHEVMISEAEAQNVRTMFDAKGNTYYLIRREKSEGIAERFGSDNAPSMTKKRLIAAIDDYKLVDGALVKREI